MALKSYENKLVGYFEALEKFIPIWKQSLLDESYNPALLAVTVLGVIEPMVNSLDEMIDDSGGGSNDG
jgi:hypothetical protein